MAKRKESIDAGWKVDNSFAQLPKTFFTEGNPAPVPDPDLKLFNQELAVSLGLNPDILKEEGIDIFAGNRVPEGSQPLAQAYAGHQFGNFTMLGDGRAVLIGEQITPSGKRLDIQLKGSGRTAYSRGGDGRAALGPMLREHIISEAMHALKVPTTRSLAVVTTGQRVRRENDPPGAILTRVAASHLRFGTFQYAAQWGTTNDLQTLADYAIERHYPDLETDGNRYLSLFRAVAARQAKLIADWQLIGFIHGVMNTDNMSISGETIDYGPCAFMDEYDPATVFSSIDLQGRYAYGNQPKIGGWNLARFAEALLPLFDENQERAVELAQNELSRYIELFQSHWLNGMRTKLGIFNQETEDESLVEELLNLMQKHQADYTNTFRALTLGKYEGAALFDTAEFKQWHEAWQERLSRQEQSTAASNELMKNSNPAIIPRNHRVEEALDAAVEKEDYQVLERLLEVLSNPYAYSDEQEEYTKLPDPSDRPYRTYCGT